MLMLQTGLAPLAFRPAPSHPEAEPMSRTKPAVLRHTTTHVDVPSECLLQRQKVL